MGGRKRRPGASVADPAKDPAKDAEAAGLSSAIEKPSGLAQPRAPFRRQPRPRA